MQDAGEQHCPAPWQTECTGRQLPPELLLLLELPELLLELEDCPLLLELDEALVEPDAPPDPPPVVEPPLVLAAPDPLAPPAELVALR